LNWSKRVQAISEVLCCADGIVSGTAEIHIAEDDAAPAYLIDPVAVLRGSGIALKVELPEANSGVSGQSVDAVVSEVPFRASVNPSARERAVDGGPTGRTRLRPLCTAESCESGAPPS
jgi:hypothetical protein